MGAHGCMHVCMNGGMDKCMSACLYGWVDGSKWVGGWCEFLDIFGRIIFSHNLVLLGVCPYN